jgi:hypothetical protein
MLRKCNKILSFLLALALVITTFGSDFANAKVFAVEEENIVEETTENTEEVLPEIFEDVNELEDAEVENTEIEENAEVEEAAPAEAAVDEETIEATVTEEVETIEEVDTTEEVATPASEENVEEPTEEALELTELTEEEKAKALKLLEEETEEAEEEEAEVEEKEFAASTEIDNLVISLYAAPGVLPADAELRVNKVSSSQEEEIKELIDGELGEENEVTETFSYDINIYSPSEDGYVQPEDGTVEVRFEEIEAAEDDSLELSVFHVDDSISDATEVASAGNEATDITFDAEHFSIYTVTIYKKVDKDGNGSGAIEFDAGVYNLAGEEIETGNSLRRVKLIEGEISAEGTAPVISPYVFDHAVYKDQNVVAFNVIKDKNVYKAYIKVQDAADFEEMDLSAEEDIQYFYKNAESRVKSTKSHIDLGFSSEEKPTVAKATITINDVEYTLGEGIHESVLGVQELRLDLPAGGLDEIFTTDKIVFQVTLLAQDAPNPVDRVYKTYTHECTTEENENAYERCINAHTYRQERYGFDYVFDFKTDFYYGASVTYHSNFGTDRTKLVTVEWETTQEDETKTHDVLTYSGTSLPDNDGYKFKGWGVKNKNTGDINLTYVYDADTGLIAPPQIELSNKDHIHLYAIWERTKSYTVNFIYQKNDGSFDYENPDHSEQYTVNIPFDATNGVEVSVVAAEPEDPTADLIYNTNSATHVTTFTNKFVDAATKIGYKNLPGADGWDRAVVRNDDVAVVINVLFVRDDFDAAFTVFAPSQTYIYDGVGHKATVGTGYASEQYRDLYTIDVVANIDGTDNKEITNVSESPAAGVNNNKVTEVTITNKISGQKYVLKVKDGKVTTKSPFSDKIQVFDGQVSILPRPLEIRVGYAEKQYDGDYFHADQYGKNIDKTTGREVITYEVKYAPDEADINLSLTSVLVSIPKDVITVEQSAVSSEEISIVENEFKILIDNKVVSKDNFNITIKNGDLRITPAENKWHFEVTIKADAEGDGNSKKVVYNGTTQSIITYLKLTVTDHEGREIIYDDSIVPVADDGRTNIAAYLLSLLQKLRGFMVLTVNAADEWVELPAQTITHDGKNYTVSGLKIKGGEGVDVNTYPVTLNYDDMDITLNGESVKSSLAEDQHGEEHIGNLQIIERNVYLSSESYSRTYDGTPLTRPVVTVDVDEANNKYDFVTGEVVDLRAIGSITDPGSVENKITYTKVADKYKDQNYIVHYNEGTLAITGGGGGDNPPSDPTPPSEPTPPSVTPPAGQVLGATRQLATGDGAAVLGARRGRTEDTTNTLGRIITIIVAAGIGFMMIFIKRKKNEE